MRDKNLSYYHYEKKTHVPRDDFIFKEAVSVLNRRITLTAMISTEGPTNNHLGHIS